MDRHCIYIKLIISGLGMMLLGACSGIDQPESQPQPEKVEQPETNTLSFVEAGLPMKTSTNFTFLEGKDLEIRYNSRLGQYELTINEIPEIIIIEDQISLEEIKSELLNDQLFSYTIYDEGSDAFTSHAKLPGGDPFTYNYFRRMELGNAAFLVRTNKDAEYTMDRAKQLKKLINSFQFI